MDKNELIAQHFAKTLSNEAQREFDDLLVTDSEFAKEVAFQNDLKTVIVKEERDAVKSQLQDFELEQKSAFNYKKWIVAASVIIVFGFSSFWYFNTPINTEKLYVENFEPYRNVVQPIVRGESQNDIQSKAFEAYETKNYKEALDFFNAMLGEKEDVTILFYKANVLLQLNEEQQAISIFKDNLKVTDSLVDKHQWYLALAYIKNNEIDNAKNQLEHLIASESTFKNNEAKKLLKKLN